MGKIIGGGLPIGAFGGRTDLMRMFHPDQSEPVMHASTFSGNPISMAAGEAAMSQADPQLIAQMNGLGERCAAASATRSGATAFAGRRPVSARSRTST